MDFELSENQAVVQDAVLAMVEPFRTVPTGASGYFQPAPALDQMLTEGGFLELTGTEGYGPLDAALLTYEIARLPVLVEVAASALTAPQLGAGALPRPIALAEGRDRPIRNLLGARTLLLIEGGEALVASLDGVGIEELPGVLGYPFGRLLDPAALRFETLGAGTGDLLARWWRIGLATEAAGLLRGALDATIDYVSQRTQFGRAIGSFQAVQHRLATSAQLTEGCRWLALRAAESGTQGDAAIAALYAQDQMRSIINDVHQFTGAIGLTLEYPLHFWTYRLKALQGELGGVLAQAEAASILFENGS